jgi:hypothetical protein|tara:strand:+ start:147 stop:335 length:189 start_codon:yes stop_codon:yes gene_type:complete
LVVLRALAAVEEVKVGVAVLALAGVVLELVARALCHMVRQLLDAYRQVLVRGSLGHGERTLV